MSLRAISAGVRYSAETTRRANNRSQNPSSSSNITSSGTGTPSIITNNNRRSHSVESAPAAAVAPSSQTTTTLNDCDTTDHRRRLNVRVRQGSNNNNNNNDNDSTMRSLISPNHHHHHHHQPSSGVASTSDPTDYYLDDGELPSLSSSHNKGSVTTATTTSHSYDHNRSRSAAAESLAASSTCLDPNQRLFWGQLDTTDVENDDDSDDEPDDEKAARSTSSSNHHNQSMRQREYRQEPRQPDEQYSAPARRTSKGVRFQSDDTTTDTDQHPDEYSSPPVSSSNQPMSVAMVDSDDAAEAATGTFCGATLQALGDICGGGGSTTSSLPAVATQESATIVSEDPSSQHQQLQWQSQKSNQRVRFAAEPRPPPKMVEPERQEEHTAIEVEFVEPAEAAEAVAAAALATTERKNAFLTAMARKAKEDFEKKKDQQQSTTAKPAQSKQQQQQQHLISDNDVYNNFSASEKRKFLKHINSGMTPKEASEQVTRERLENDRLAEEWALNKKQTTTGGANNMAAVAASATTTSTKKSRLGFLSGLLRSPSRQQQTDEDDNDGDYDVDQANRSGHQGGNDENDNAPKAPSSQRIHSDEATYSTPPRSAAPATVTPSPRAMGNKTATANRDEQRSPTATDSPEGAYFAKSGINYYDAVRKVHPEDEEEEAAAAAAIPDKSQASRSVGGRKPGAFAILKGRPSPRVRIDDGEDDEKEDDVDAGESFDERGQTSSEVVEDITSTENLEQRAPAFQTARVEPATTPRTEYYETPVESKSRFVVSPDQFVPTTITRTANLAINQTQSSESGTLGDDEDFRRIEENILRRPETEDKKPPSTEEMTSRTVPATRPPVNPLTPPPRTQAANKGSSEQENYTIVAVSPLSVNGEKFEVREEPKAAVAKDSKPKKQVKIDNMDVNMITYMNSYTGSSHAGTYDNMSVFTAGTGLTGASSYTQSSRVRRPGAAKERLAKAKKAAEAAASKKGWHESIRAAAAYTNRVWDPVHGWIDYEDPNKSAAVAPAPIVIRDPEPAKPKEPKIHLNLEEKVKKHPRSDEQQQIESTGQPVPVPFPESWAEERNIMLQKSVDSKQVSRDGNESLQRDGAKVVDSRTTTASQVRPTGWTESMKVASAAIANDGRKWDPVRGWTGDAIVEKRAHDIADFGASSHDKAAVGPSSRIDGVDTEKLAVRSVSTSTASSTTDKKLNQWMAAKAEKTVKGNTAASTQSSDKAVIASTTDSETVDPRHPSHPRSPSFDDPTKIPPAPPKSMKTLDEPNDVLLQESVAHNLQPPSASNSVRVPTQPTVLYSASARPYVTLGAERMKSPGAAVSSSNLNSLRVPHEAENQSRLTRRIAEESTAASQSIELPKNKNVSSPQVTKVTLEGKAKSYGDSQRTSGRRDDDFRSQDIYKSDSFPSMSTAEANLVSPIVNVVREKVGRDELGLFTSGDPKSAAGVMELPISKSRVKQRDSGSLNDLEEEQSGFRDGSVVSQTRNTSVVSADECDDSRLVGRRTAGPVDVDEVETSWDSDEDKGHESTWSGSMLSSRQQAGNDDKSTSTASSYSAFTKKVPKLTRSKRDTSPVQFRGPVRRKPETILEQDQEEQADISERQHMLISRDGTDQDHEQAADQADPRKYFAQYLGDASHGHQPSHEKQRGREHWDQPKTLKVDEPRRDEQDDPDPAAYFQQKLVSFSDIGGQRLALTSGLEQPKASRPTTKVAVSHIQPAYSRGLHHGDDRRPIRSDQEHSLAADDDERKVNHAGTHEELRYLDSQPSHIPQKEEKHFVRRQQIQGSLESDRGADQHRWGHSQGEQKAREAESNPEQQPVTKPGVVKTRLQEWESRAARSEEGAASHVSAASAEWKSFLTKKVIAETAAAAMEKRSTAVVPTRESELSAQADTSKRSPLEPTSEESRVEFKNVHLRHVTPASRSIPGETAMSSKNQTARVVIPREREGHARNNETKHTPIVAPDEESSLFKFSDDPQERHVATSADRSLTGEESGFTSYPSRDEYHDDEPVESEAYGPEEGDRRSFFKRFVECASPMMPSSLQGDGMPMAHLAFLRSGTHSAGRFAPPAFCGGRAEAVQDDESVDSGAMQPSRPSRKLANKIEGLKSSRSADRDHAGDGRSVTSSVISAENYGAKTAYLESLAMMTAVSKPRKGDRRYRSASGSSVTSNASSHSEKWKSFLERKRSRGMSPSPMARSVSASDVTKAAERYAAEKVDEMMSMMSRRSQSAPRTRMAVSQLDGMLDASNLNSSSDASPEKAIRKTKSESVTAAEDLAAARVEAMMAALSGAADDDYDEGEI